MLILAIDTSTDILGLALLKDQKIIGEYNLSLKRQHSEKLMPLIEQIFALLEIKASDLDGVAVSTGPGSFTGLRIGITVAKILGRIFSIPVKGVSSLEIMASSVAADYILPLIDARRKRVYYQLFNAAQNLGAEKSFNKEQKFILKPLQKAAAAEIIKLPEILSAYKDKKITIIGQKTAAVKTSLTANGFQIKETAANQNYPRASVLADLASFYFKSDQEDDIYQLKPTYLKKPQAEINWQQKYGGK